MPQTLYVDTPGRGFTDITARIQQAVREASDARAGAAKTGISETNGFHGVAHVFIQHTSASLTIQENADPDVLSDLEDALDRLAPEGFPYRHSAEGPDDMPAHIKAALTATSLAIPVSENALMLGTWQGVYVVEHRRAPQRRRIIVTLNAEF